MAIRHVRAVQEHSRITDDQTRHVLEIVALDIGRADEPAYTSNRKMAQRARCAINTARNCIQAAIDSGELIAIKDGKYMFYSLNPELLPYGRTSETPKGDRAENGRKGSDKRIATQADLDTLYQRLYQENERLYQGLYQKIVSIVSSPSTGRDTEVKERFIEKEGKEVVATTALTCYENNIGALTPMIQEKIITAVNDLSEQWVIDAIVEAVGRKVFKWAYVQAILNRWKTEGRGGGFDKNGTAPPQKTQQELIAEALKSTGEW